MRDKSRQGMTLRERVESYKGKIVWEHELVHDRNIPFYSKKTKEPIEVRTNAGNYIILKWEKAEYKAYSQDGKYLGIGATVPDNLITYLKENY